MRLEDHAVGAELITTGEKQEIALHEILRVDHQGLPIAANGGATWKERAESLGGVESLIAHPATMTHASMTEDAKARAGLVDGLLRLSIGIEAGADLCADLDDALARALAAA